MKAQAILSMIAAAACCGAGATAVWAQCCDYNYSFPDGQPGGGACQGDGTIFCESDSFDGNEGFVKIDGTRPSKCYGLYLEEGQNFVKHSCSSPPSSGATLIGEIGDGVCCWVVGPGSHLPDEDMPNPNEFHVAICDGPCEGGGAGDR